MSHLPSHDSSIVNFSFETVSVCSSGWSQILCEIKAGLELNVILLPEPPKHWDHMHTPLHLAPTFNVLWNPYGLLQSGCSNFHSHRHGARVPLAAPLLAPVIISHLTKLFCISVSLLVTYVIIGKVPPLPKPQFTHL